MGLQLEEFVLLGVRGKRMLAKNAQARYAYCATALCGAGSKDKSKRLPRVR